MRFVRAAVLSLAVSVTLVACDDETTGLTGLDIADLAGDWRASEFAYTHAENPDIVAPIIFAGGTFDVTVQESGAFSATLGLPNQATGEVDQVPLSGTLVLEDDETISIDFDGQTEGLGFSDFSATYTLDEPILTWEADDVDFDFPGDGVDGEVAATLSVVLRRMTTPT